MSAQFNDTDLLTEQDLDRAIAYKFAPPGGRVLATRCGPLRRIALHLHRAWLGWQIRETEAYLADCTRDGLLDSLSLRDFRGQLQALRVRLALVEAEL